MDDAYEAYEAKISELNEEILGYQNALDEQGQREHDVAQMVRSALSDLYEKLSKCATRILFLSLPICETCCESRSAYVASSWTLGGLPVLECHTCCGSLR